MGCQTLHEQFIVSISIGLIFSGFLLKNFKGLSDKDILGHIITMWSII